MSLKLKVSYENEKELQQVVDLLRPVMKQCKKASKQGKYSRAYIEVRWQIWLVKQLTICYRTDIINLQANIESTPVVILEVVIDTGTDINI